MQSLVFKSRSSLFKVRLKVDGLTLHKVAVLVKLDVSHSLKKVAASFKSITLICPLKNFILQKLQYKRNNVPFYKISVIIKSTYSRVKNIFVIF